MKMFTSISIVILALVLALVVVPAEARYFNLTIINQRPDPVYVITPWEMYGLTSQPPDQPGVWNGGWNVGTIYTVPESYPPPSAPTVITLDFILSSKSSHVMRASKTYAGAQANDNSVPCSGFPITITGSTPSWIQLYAGGQEGTYVCCCLTYG